MGAPFMPAINARMAISAMIAKLGSAAIEDGTSSPDSWRSRKRLALQTASVPKRLAVANAQETMRITFSDKSMADQLTILLLRIHAD
jgi:hypothetical protein